MNNQSNTQRAFSRPETERTLAAQGAPMMDDAGWDIPAPVAANDNGRA